VQPHPWSVHHAGPGRQAPVPAPRGRSNGGLRGRGDRRSGRVYDPVL